MKDDIYAVSLKGFLSLGEFVIVEDFIPVVGAGGLTEEILHLVLEVLLPVVARSPVPIRQVSLQQGGAQRQAAGQERLHISGHFKPVSTSASAGSKITTSKTSPSTTSSAAAPPAGVDLDGELRGAGSVGDLQHVLRPVVEIYPAFSLVELQ